MFIVARASNDIPAFPSTLRRAVTEVDPAVGISTIDTFDSLVSEAAAQPRFRTITLVAVAVLATLLAAIGLYGVIGYAVSQRTAEFGIRLALGAAHGDVVRLVLREGAWLGAAGVALGVVAARVFARVTAGLVYGVQPTDAASFGGAAAALFLVAMIASYVPARRASHINPLVALRHE
jgi:putative ABC transport system permease protein